jgi:hypothetical protein
MCAGRTGGSGQTSPKGWLFVGADSSETPTWPLSSATRRRMVYRLVDRCHAILRVVQRSTSKIR